MLGILVENDRTGLKTGSADNLLAFGQGMDS